MAEYIDKAEILAELDDAIMSGVALTDCDPRVFEIIRIFKRMVNDFSAADVQPNKKSQWQQPLMGQGKCETYCGRCFGKIMRNSTGIFEETPFCPHCGADMRGDENG